MVGADAPIVKGSLERDGVALVRAVVRRDAALRAAAGVDEAITGLAAEIGRTLELYLRSVSVWRSRSRVAAGVVDLERAVGVLVRQVLGREVGATKTNVIRKSRLSPQGTPWHQDAPYARREPYVVSTWLALDDVATRNGALRFLLRSHRGPPSPKTDYWRPDFEDRAPSTEGREVSFPVSAGDLLIFDPLVWHASFPCSSGERRLAVSTRWTWPGYEWPFHLPASPEVEFGMSNAARVTDDVLRRAHELIFGPAPSEADAVLSAWRARLVESVPSGVDPAAADALSRLETLRLAHRLQDAGDQEGQVHLDVWRTLLAPLRRRLEARSVT